jgi:transposase
MPRALTVTPHLAVADLAHRYRHTQDAVERTHWQIVWLVAQGHPVPEVARLVGYTANWVRTIVHRYNDGGPEGLTDRRRHNPGQRPLLSPALMAELAAAVEDGPAPDGGGWSCRQAATWMSARLGRPVADVRGWEALRALGFTLQRPRPRATQADPDAQAAFKKGGSRPRWTRSGPLTPRPP